MATLDVFAPKLQQKQGKNNQLHLASRLLLASLQLSNVRMCRQSMDNTGRLFQLCSALGSVVTVDLYIVKWHLKVMLAVNLLSGPTYRCSDALNSAKRQLRMDHGAVVTLASQVTGCLFHPFSSAATPCKSTWIDHRNTIAGNDAGDCLRVVGQGLLWRFCECMVAFFTFSILSLAAVGI